ncbi:MAG: deoxyribodipyrimidine photo-lyase [Thermomicrobiales bacterium]
MAGIDRFVAEDDPWSEVLNQRDIPDDPACVLLWVQRAQRATENRAVNLAVAIGNALQIPVVACFVLVPAYPEASRRAYQFMAEGLAELPEAFAARGIVWTLQTGDSAQIVPKQAHDLKAAAVITDLDPLRTASGWKTTVAERIKAPLVVVATDTIAPPSAFPALEYAARTIRPKLWRMVAADPGLLDAIPTTRAKAPSPQIDPGPDPLEAVKRLYALHDDAPSDLRGGAKAAKQRLASFIEERLPEYPHLRSHPNLTASSRLSAYLHFGQISPLAVARAAITARAGDRAWVAPKDKATIGAGRAITDEALQAFLDEVVTQRELGVNFCLREPAYDAWNGLPDWGQRTLLEHLGDPRPITYTVAKLEAGETDDALWNAAQRQMVAQGFMPNRLRMYWGKQLLQWTTHPEEALDIAVQLNDRYQLDGRDANGYANIAWAIGGRHDRPFPPNKPILGLVRPMSARGMARGFDTAAYIAQVAELTGGAVPGSLPER